MASAGGAIKMGFSILMIVIVGLIFWLGAVSGGAAAYAKYMISERSKPDALFYTFPSWIQPNGKWHDWVGYPEKFSNISGFIPTSYTKISVVDSVSTDADCMLGCAANEKCTGFLMSNLTCTLYNSVGALFPNVVSNTMIYSVTGKEPTTMYTLNAGKMPPAFPSVALTSGLTIGSNDISITGIVCGTSICTATTKTPHGFTGTSTVTVYNYGTVTFMNGSPANTPYTIPSGLATPTTTTFTFPSSYTGTIGAALASSSLLPSTGADTILFNSAAHGYAVGDTVSITGTTGPSIFSNIFEVTSVPTTTSFGVKLVPPSILGQTATGGKSIKASSLSAFVGKTPFDCAAACSSNAACIAFMFDNTSLVCNQQSIVNTGTMVTSVPATIDTYTTSVPKFTDAGQYY